MEGMHPMMLYTEPKTYSMTKTSEGINLAFTQTNG